MKIVGSKVTRTYGYRIYNLELIIYSYNKKNYNYNQIVSYDILDNSSLIFFSVETNGAKNIYHLAIIDYYNRTKKL